MNQWLRMEDYTPHHVSVKVRMSLNLVDEFITALGLPSRSAVGKCAWWLEVARKVVPLWATDTADILPS